MDYSAKTIKKGYSLTLNACFIGYIAQAVVNNFVPLLFVTFQQGYDIPLSRITVLITVNFAVQLIVDVLSAKLIKKIGYRTAAVTAHACCAGGLALLAFLPEAMPDPFTGILIAVFVYALGGGLIEVIISPIAEACPTKNKEKTMSILHSFYCWGHVGVVLLSTLFFRIFGIENWKVLSWIWALVPLLNILLFSVAPIYPLEGDGEKGLSVKQLFSMKIFWALMIMMICAGASEQAVAQWASAFAEQSLGISKTAGDLLGPMTFALTMGISRAIFGAFGDKINLERFMVFSCILCIISYMCISLVPVASVGLAGCALCGFSVGIMWPGTFSRSTVLIRKGGTSLFALLALAGDIGCAGGPAIAGFVSGVTGDNLKTGILAAVIFPAIMLACFVFTVKRKKNEMLQHK